MVVLGWVENHRQSAVADAISWMPFLARELVGCQKCSNVERDHNDSSGVLLDCIHAKAFGRHPRHLSCFVWWIANPSPTLSQRYKREREREDRLPTVRDDV